MITDVNVEKLAETVKENADLKAKLASRAKHSGDCHWWTYKVCDCGYLMRANSHDFGEPSEQVIADFLEHSDRIQRAEITRAKLASVEADATASNQMLQKIYQSYFDPTIRVLASEVLASIAPGGKALLDTAQRRLELLKKVEWVEMNSLTKTWHACAICFGVMPDHKPACPLAAELEGKL